MMPESNLILNPYLSLILFKNQNQIDCLRFSSPVKNVGAQMLEFERAQNPNLYDLFFELNQSSLNFLDIKQDLSDAERKLLTENGVLIAPDQVSQPPTFACLLDEIEIDSSMADVPDLIVNQSFYYDDAQNYEALVGRRKYGFEPFQPIVWVRNPKTEITAPFWVRDDFLTIAKNLQAGEKPAIPLTDQQNTILRQAEILVAPNLLNQSAWNNHLNAAADFFQKEKYAVVRNILQSIQLTAIQRYFTELRKQGFMIFNDHQVSRRHAIHNDALSIYFHEQLAPLVSRVVGQTVKPSYVYSAIYVEDAVLEPHTDRPQCEFTMSMQIGYQPELKRHDSSPWALCLDDLQGNRVETHLANGDAMIYKGCELVHYRDALFKNHQSTSVFFHFVPQDFDGFLN